MKTKKFFTRPLLWYTLAMIPLSALFWAGLYVFSRTESYFYLIATVVICAAVAMFAGYRFGKKDSELMPRRDIGVRFGLAFYAAFAGVAELWLALGFHDLGELTATIHIFAVTSVFMMAVVFVSYMIQRKKDIGGIDKKELFD